MNGDGPRRRVPMVHDDCLQKASGEARLLLNIREVGYGQKRCTETVRCPRCHCNCSKREGGPDRNRGHEGGEGERCETPRRMLADAAGNRGPYYFNPNLVRRNITEGRTGASLHLVFTVIDVNCNVLPN